MSVCVCACLCVCECICGAHADVHLCVMHVYLCALPTVQDNRNNTYYLLLAIS